MVAVDSIEVRSKLLGDISSGTVSSPKRYRTVTKEPLSNSRLKKTGMFRFERSMLIYAWFDFGASGEGREGAAQWRAAVGDICAHLRTAVGCDART